MSRNLDIIKTVKRKIKLIVAVFQFHTLSSVLTLICMNDLTGSKVLIGKPILCLYFLHITRPRRRNQLCKISCRSIKGLRCGGGPKIACSHRKAESSITLHCTTVHAVI
jgi:hypothetical protein